MANKIFVIGSVNTDLVIHAPYFPKQGETLSGGGFFTARGGKGANQAVAAARAGGEVVLCACVGEDGFGKEALAAFHKEGIDVSCVRTVSAPTGTAVIIVSGGDNRIVLDRGANAELSKEDVENVLLSAQPGDVLLAQLENPVETIGYALKRGREKGMKVVLNPAPADPAILPYAKECDLLIPNETEAEILGGGPLGGKETIVTLGAEGYDLYSGGRVHVPGLKIKAVDTTGAGDTFCGSLCARLALGEDTASAAEYARAAAALACTKSGAQPSIPTKEEIELFLTKNSP